MVATDEREVGYLYDERREGQSTVCVCVFVCRKRVNVLMQKLDSVS